MKTGQFEPIDFTDTKIRLFTERCRDKSVLDLGVVHHDAGKAHGRHWLHRAILSVATHAVGLDIDEPGIRQLNDWGFDVREANAENFDLSEQFDIVAAGDIIEHVADHKGFIECCRKHLKPDGMLLVSTPNPWYWKFVVKAAKSGELNVNPEHTCWFCPRTLRQLVQRYGLDIDEVQYLSRPARQRLNPLPAGLRHTTWFAQISHRPTG